MKKLRGFLAGTALAMLVAGNVQAATSPVEMLRDIFRRPETEWRQVMSESKPLLDEQFFQNVEKRIRWGIENNHIDDAFRFAMVGDFAAEVKNRPANFRIDLAELFFQAENTTMAGQIVENIIVTSPTTPAAQRARFLKARLYEMQKDLFSAHQLYVELAQQGYESGESWFKAGQISMLIQQESRAEKEWENAAKAGHVQAGIELEKYRKAKGGDWAEIIAPIPNRPGLDTSTPISTAPPPAEDDPLAAAEEALAAGDLDLARAKLETAYQKSSQDPEITRRLAALLYRMGRLEEAKAFLDTALGRSPQDVELIRFRANTEERLYDRNNQKQYLERALADYGKAVRLAPNHRFLPMEYQRAQTKQAERAQARQ